ncbi:hypothetical protein D3C77_309340 [compost metagenome]
MAMIYEIPRGTLESGPMSLDYDSGLATIQYYDAGGVEITPTGVATISVSPTLTGENFKTVYPEASGQWAFEGPCGRLRVSLAGTNAVTAYVRVWRGDDSRSGIPGGAFSGYRAMTTQSYVEANVKYGLQFYLQYNLPQLPATTGIHKVLFTTGAKQVLIKGREMYGIGESISIQVYKQPTAPTPGGTLLTVQNFNDVAPAATTVTIRGGVTTTSDGATWGDPQRLFGQSAAGQRAGSGLAPGGDRILKPNSTYLVVFRNTGSGTADIDYFLTWYEGGTDLPLS